MKKILCFIFVLVSLMSAFAQNKLNRYEYWFDQNYAGKSTVNITPVDMFTLNSTLTTGGITNGLHTFNLRFRDDSARWSSVISQFFYKIGDGNDTLRKIAKYQYWIDQDFTNQKTINVAPNAQGFNLSSTLDFNVLANGMHTLNTRFMDHTGLWSIVTSQFFFKTEMKGYAGSDSMVEVEYWNDQNYAGRTNTMFSPKNQILYLNSLNMSDKTIGIHTLNMRFRDGKGLWSEIISQFYFKTEMNGYSSSDSIVEIEYWTDENYSGKTKIAISPKNQLVYLNTLDMKNTSEGIHTFNIRFRDGKGLWSEIINQFFYKLKPAMTGINLVNAYRYWYDERDTAIQTVTISPPVNPYNLNLSMDMTQEWKGIHLLHFQFRDTAGNWSVVISDTFNKKALPIANFSASKHIFCDSGLVNFTNTSIDYDTLHWDFGDGIFSTVTNPSHKYSVPGKYAVKLWIKDTGSALTSQKLMTDSVIISKTPLFTFGKDTAVCANSGFILHVPAGTGYTYLWQNASTLKDMIPQTTGKYICKVNNTSLCQWSDTINITIKPLAKAAFSFIINNNQVTFNDSSKNAMSYLWKFGDGNTNTQTNPIHNYPAIGNYTVWQIVKNTCNSDSLSRIINIIKSGIHTFASSSTLVAYPNPTSGIVTIQFEDIGAIQSILIFSADGKEISSGSNIITSEKRMAIDLDDQADGVYRIQLITLENTYTISIIKRT